MSLEILGSKILEDLNDSNTNPEQSIPDFVVPPHLYRVPSNCLA
tara:strand:+ start:471 stop:602 length:132 start_codon:yes stop_codon:yes gene_type:complete